MLGLIKKQLRPSCLLPGRLFPLTVRFTRIIAVNHNHIGRGLFLPFQVTLDDLLGSVGVPLLSVEGGTAIMRDHTVSAA